MTREDATTLSVEQELRIDRLCERFEEALRGGEALSLEQVVAEVGDALAGPLLRELVPLDREYRGRDGAADAAEYTTRFPAHAAAIEAALREVRGRRVVGPYEIVRRLGEGGMGRVYEARQSNPRRTVALKVIRPEYTSPSLLRRFRLEAEVLGRLQHPGIAHIYEAGSTSPEGGGAAGLAQPYFAMELIEGRPLTEYAQRERLDAEAKIELMLSICDAVQFAHQRGVIHRDLKPNNILVRADGHPKIIDFGVARLVDVDQASLQTGAGQLIGTVAYMSPEQVAADPDRIDTRCDIYALGVILFELLSGRLPLPVADRPIPAALRALQEEEPTRLGSVVPEHRGDLEVIVDKALEKDRQRRYASAGELAADLRRFLAHEPILARRASVLYQVTKFSRRHRGLVAGVAMTFLVLCVSVVLLWLRSESEARLRAAADTEATRFRQISEFLQTILSETTPMALSESRRVTVPEMLRWAASVVPDHFPDSADVEVTVRTMLGRSLHHHGELEISREQLRRAEELLETAPTVTDEQRAATWEALAQSYLIGEELDLALRYFDEAKDAQARIHGRESEPVAIVLIQQVGIHVLRDDLAAAAEVGKRGVDIVRRIGRPDTLIGGLSNLGAVHARAGRLDAAGECFEEAIAVARENGLDSDYGMAALYSSYGVVLRMSERLDEAIELYRTALESFAESLDDSHHQIAATTNNLARAYHFRGRRDASPGDFALAESNYRESLALRRDQLREGHPKIAESVCNLAELLHYDLGRSAEAAELFAEGLSIERESYGDQDFRVAMHASNLGDVLLALGRPSEAIDRLEEAGGYYEAADADPPSEGRIHVTWALARALEAEERFEDAARLLATLVRYVEEHAPDREETVAKLREDRKRCAVAAESGS